MSARAAHRGHAFTAAVLSSLAVLLGLVVVTGCGAGIVVQDDFVVQRTGNVPGADLTLVVNDAGTAACDHRPPVPITDPQLIQARYIQTTMATPAQQGLNLPAGPRPVFHYLARTPDGHVGFYDDSKGQPSIFGALTLLTLQIAEQDCHLAL